MKVGFIGVPSTGKSRLSSYVATITEMLYVPEVIPQAFEVCKRQDILNLSSYRLQDLRDPIDLQRFENGMILAQQEEELRSGGNFVADSAQLEQLLYWLYWCADHAAEEETEQVWNETLEYSLHYDVIFKMPYGVLPIEDNNFRTTNFFMIRNMEGVLRMVVEAARNSGINVIDVPPVNDFGTRVAFVSQTLKRMGYVPPSLRRLTVQTVPVVANTVPAGPYQSNITYQFVGTDKMTGVAYPITANPPIVLSSASESDCDCFSMGVRNCSVHGR